MTVQYKFKENSPWLAVKSLSHGGNATGKLSNCSTTKGSNNQKQPIDFSKTGEWKIIENTHANHETEIVEQLSNLSLEEDEIYHVIFERTILEDCQW